MKKIAGYVTDYFRYINLRYFIFISLILSILIWFNYQFRLNSLLLSGHDFTGRFWRTYFLYFLTFSSTWIAGFVIPKQPLPQSPFFWLLLTLAPAIFAIKVSIQISDFSVHSNYWSIVLNWPLKAVVTFALSFVLWFTTNNSKPFAGLSSRGFNAMPYFILLLLMAPLLVWAGRGADFQQVYPKLQMIHEPVNIIKKLIFELSYGLDFFTIELFFRGFLIIAFIKYGGKAAILPMAAFYCTIHFGKPLFECISSYFGGLILGSVVYYTRSIWGGLIVHLGIAWAMEIIGIIY